MHSDENVAGIFYLSHGSYLSFAYDHNVWKKVQSMSAFIKHRPVGHVVFCRISNLSCRNSVLSYRRLCSLSGTIWLTNLIAKIIKLEILCFRWLISISTVKHCLTPATVVHTSIF